MTERSHFFSYLAAFTLSALIGLSVSEASEKPNVVVFLVDDMGVMDTSVPFMTDSDGKAELHPLNRFYRTPNMERLAKQGIRFSDFYAMSVCSPTRVSIMTGQTSARHRTTQYIKPESDNRGTFGPEGWHWSGITKDAVTLPAAVRQAGYRTIHCGKAHFGPKDSFGADPINIGFDVNIAGCAYGRPSTYYGEKNFGNGKKGLISRAVPGLEKYHGKNIYLTEALTIEFNAALKQAVADEKPFFGYMSHYAVHAPFNPDPRFSGNYPKGAKGAFASMIEGMDKSLGDVLDTLNDLGVAKDTLVIFLGDNGTDAPLGDGNEIACAEPLRAKKGAHYEGGMRVPFIAAWAKRDAANAHQKRLPIPAGVIQGQIGDVTDLFPTILKLVGAAAPEGHVVDGVDLAMRLMGKHDSGREPTFLMHFPHAHRSDYFTAYRKGDWKVIYHYQPETEGAVARYELFNLKSDRSESENLATHNPEKLSGMVQAMMAALSDANAQYPISKDGKILHPLAPKGP